MEIQSKYYGRKNARALTSEEKKFYEDDYPQLKFDGTGDILEIGFGMGDFLIHQASIYPNQKFIGVEPFKTGLIRVIKKTKQLHINNIRLYHGVVYDIIDKLPNLSAAYILYPDPWPKKKHHKRRLIQKDFLLKLASHIKKGGNIFIASDHADYQEWIESVLEETWGIVFLSNDTFKPFDHWISTKYEKKAIQEGRVPKYYRVSL